jgi:hypothetical protein
MQEVRPNLDGELTLPGRARTSAPGFSRSDAVRKSQVVHSARTLETAIEILCSTYVRDGATKMTVVGYARVSTDGQTLDAQQATLKVQVPSASIPKRSVAPSLIAKR